MNTITLTNGGVAWVDTEDYHACCQHLWWMDPAGYAITKCDGRVLKLHNFLLGDPHDGLYVDHRDGNRLDCRRHNLRWATRGQNAANCKRHDTENRTSTFKGVHRLGDSWVAQIQKDKKKQHLGSYTTELDAAHAYDAAAARLFGAFARLNFPTESPTEPVMISPTSSESPYPQSHCIQCGNAFERRRKDRKYCTRRCAYRYFYDHSPKTPGPNCAHLQGGTNLLPVHALRDGEKDRNSEEIRTA